MMGKSMDHISAEGVSIRFDPQCGVIDDLAIECGGVTLRPMHRAPWVVSGESLSDQIAPVERKLAGDFFCAPFGRSAADVPIHGWAANGNWEGIGQTTAGGGAVTARFSLRETIHGARLVKEITLRPGQPVVYQRHVFDGGEGHIPVAHHAMVRVPGGAALSFSPKAYGRTTNSPLESDPARGRSLLKYPQRIETLAQVALADGGTADATTYPFAQRHEDFIALVEEEGARIGWSAALAAKDGFLFFAVKDAAALPETLLWMSNGGRDYAPWSGRHSYVLGIEEAASSFHISGERADGHDAARATGVELREGAQSVIRYAFGAIPSPQGWTRVSEVEVSDGTLKLIDAGGDSRILAFDSGFFR
jgi:hypothetical protein